VVREDAGGWLNPAAVCPLRFEKAVENRPLPLDTLPAWKQEIEER
jgi:hypothetical protein